MWQQQSLPLLIVQQSAINAKFILSFGLQARLCVWRGGGVSALSTPGPHSLSLLCFVSNVFPSQSPPSVSLQETLKNGSLLKFVP